MLFTALQLVAAFLIPAALLFHWYSRPRSSPSQPKEKSIPDEKPKSIMQPPKLDLAPPKDNPFTEEQLSQYDGSDPSKPIYVAIKGSCLPRNCTKGSVGALGRIFDVTRKADVYGPGKSYNIFAGKDGSRGLGMSSLKTEDAVADYSTLDEKDRTVLDDWYKFFSCVSSLTLSLTYNHTVNATTLLELSCILQYPLCR